MGGTILSSVGVVLLMLSQDNSSVVIPIVFAIFTGFGMGVAPMTCYAAVADRFHGRHYGSIQGTVVMSASLGGAIGPWIGGVLHDMSGNYQSALVVVVFFFLTGVLFMWLIRPGRGDVRA
jgi:MFS family permease